MDPHARDVLVGLRYGIGDVVMQHPVLEALRRALPRARITAVAAPPATELLDDLRLVDEVVSVARWGIAHRWDEGGPAGGGEIRAWVAGRRFDLYLDVRHLPPALSRAILDHGARPLDSAPGAEAAAIAAGAGGVEAIGAGVRAGWGMEVPRRDRPRIRPTEEERAFARRYLDERGIDGAAFAVSPVASLTMKRWPAERFAAVADRVAEPAGEPLLLFCGPQGDAGDAFLAAVRRPERVVRVGALHLRRVAALLERCRAFLCNDTGLMHVAAAVGTRTVGVFGPTPPSIYRPRAPHVRSVGGVDVDCPHRNTRSLAPPECWGPDRCLIAEEGCILHVGVEEVSGAVLHALGPRGERRGRRGIAGGTGFAAVTRSE
jgi:ADP-heptose:LPS heptosyltransferase